MPTNDLSKWRTEKDETTDLPFAAKHLRFLHGRDSLASVSIADSLILDAFRAVRRAETSPAHWREFSAAEQLRLATTDILEGTHLPTEADRKSAPLLYAAAEVAAAWIRHYRDSSDDGESGEEKGGTPDAG